MDKRASAPEKEPDNLEDNNNIKYPAPTSAATVVDLEIQDIEGVGPTTAQIVRYLL
jgi:hypothetical protein